MTYSFWITPEDYAIAEQNGINQSCLEARIRSRGWRKEKAVSTPPLPKKSHGQWAEIAERNGIKKNTFYRRVNQYDWSYERAATEIRDKREFGRELGLRNKRCD